MNFNNKFNSLCFVSKTFSDSRHFEFRVRLIICIRNNVSDLDSGRSGTREYDLVCDILGLHSNKILVYCFSFFCVSFESDFRKISFNHSRAYLCYSYRGVYYVKS